MRSQFLVAGIAVLGASVAAAQSAVINACVANRDGSLRVLSAGASCTTKETPLTWNVQGPTGPVGPEGPAGEDGAGLAMYDPDGNALAFGAPGAMSAGLLTAWGPVSVQWSSGGSDSTGVNSIYVAGGSRVFYAIDGCAGQAFATPDTYFLRVASPTAPVASNAPYAMSVYAADFASANTTRTYSSVRNTNGSCENIGGTATGRLVIELGTVTGSRNSFLFR